jgi:hypothetical protein
MTTVTAPSQPPVGLVPLFAGVLRPEARQLGTVRSAFWALAAAVAFNVVTAALFVPTLLTALLPSSWQDTLGPYLPMNAGDTRYAAAALAAGFVLSGRRDA